MYWVIFVNLYKPNPLIIALLSVLFLVSGQTVFADSQKKFERLLHIDLFGDDITERGFKGISVPECENLCSSNNECVAYTYIVSKSWCFIKNGEGQPQHKPDVVSGVLNKTTFSNPAKNMQKPELVKDPSCKQEIQQRVEAIEARDGFDNHVDTLLVDINSDGRDEILYSEVCSGNSCYPDFGIVYFTETCQRKFKWLDRWKYVFSLGSVEFDYDDQFAYITGTSDRYDLEVTDLNKSYVTYKFDGKSVKYVSTKKADLLQSVKEITSTELAQKAEAVCKESFECLYNQTITMEFDLNKDGKLESISCGYWPRWGVLDQCEISSQGGENIVIAVDSFSTKRLGVLPEKYNGWHVLVADYEDKLIYEDGIGYVVDRN